MLPKEFFVKCVRPFTNLRFGSADGKADGDKTAQLSSGINWGATDSCDIPPTTFSQLIKLRTKPRKKTQFRICAWCAVLSPDNLLRDLLRHNCCWNRCQDSLSVRQSPENLFMAPLDMFKYFYISLQVAISEEHTTHKMFLSWATRLFLLLALHL